MADGPWTKYQRQEDGPWTKYQGLTGADAMRARGLSSPDPAAANAQAEAAMGEGFVREHPVASRAAAFTAGIPFVGEWYDEALDQVQPGAGARLQGARDAFSAARPTEDALWRLGGGMAGSVAALPAAAAAGPSTLGMQVLAGGAGGAVAGATDSALAAAGRAAPGERGEAARGAILPGAALGAGVGAAAPVVARGVKEAVNYLRGSDIGTISNALGISPAAARAVKEALQGENMPAAAARLHRGGPEAMLVEAGPATEALGSATAASGGRATTIMREGIEDRAASAAGQVQGALDNTLGVPAGRADLSAGIRKATQKARGAAYDAAYATPIDYASPAGRRIEELLARVPAKTANRAIETANERLAYEGGQKQIMASIGDDGKVVFQEMPNAMQLDHLKRAFDRIVRDGTDAVTGKLSSDAQFASTIARDLRNAHAAANPGYRQALRTGMDSIQAEEAVETGYKALTSTPEQVRKGLKGLNQDARKAAKLGARQYIEDQMAAVKAIMSRPGMENDVGEAMKAVREIGSRRARENLTLLVGKKEADQLLGQMDELKTAFEIQAALSRNSDTAVRQAVQTSVKASAAPNVVQRLMAGEPLQASKRLTQIFTGSSPEAVAAREAGIFEEIAKALTQTKGPQAERALVFVNQAMKGQKFADSRAAAVSRLVASALAGGGYQQGNRYIQGR